MDLQDILKKCGYNSSDDTSRETYNQKIISTTQYLDPDSDDLCTDVQTLFNIGIDGKDNVSYGSSYKYTITPYLDNAGDNANDLDIKRAKGHEHFYDKDNDSYNRPIYVRNIYRGSFLYDYSLIIVFFMIILCVSVILVNRRCYPF